MRTAITRATAIASAYTGARYVAARLDPAHSFNPIGEVAAAVLLGVTLAWLIENTPGSSPGRVASIGLVVFASVAAVMVEGSAFAPTLSPVVALPIGLVLQLGVSGLTAAVAVAVTPGRPGPPTPGRPATCVPARVTAAAFAYVAAYFATGAICYALVTGPYYAVHAGGLIRPEPAVVLVIAGIEGVLLTVGALPLATTLSGSPRSRALACGLALWALGGLVPLLQEAALPDVVRIASAVEILFQKAPLGMAIVWLLGGSSVRPLEPIAPARLGRIAE